MLNSLKSTSSHNRIIQVFTLDNPIAVHSLEKTFVLVVRVVNFQKDKPIKNVNVKFFRLENEPISLKQWGETSKMGLHLKSCYSR
jgi:hypothetical protein